MRAPLFALAATALLSMPGTAMACTCAMPEAGRLKQSADLVFRGKVIDAGLRVFGKATATFWVDQSWKGAVGKSVRVRARAQSAACGIAFKRDRTYLVFARRNKGKYWTSSCSAFSEVDFQRKIEADLGEGLKRPTDR